MPSWKRGVRPRNPRSFANRRRTQIGSALAAGYKHAPGAVSLQPLGAAAPAASDCQSPTKKVAMFPEVCTEGSKSWLTPRAQGRRVRPPRTALALYPTSTRSPGHRSLCGALRRHAYGSVKKSARRVRHEPGHWYHSAKPLVCKWNGNGNGNGNL